MCSYRGHGVECTDYCNCDPSKCENTDGSPSALINENLDNELVLVKSWDFLIKNVYFYRFSIYIDNAFFS